MKLELNSSTIACLINMLCNKDHSKSSFALIVGLATGLIGYITAYAYASSKERTDDNES